MTRAKDVTWREIERQLLSNGDGSLTVSTMRSGNRRMWAVRTYSKTFGQTKVGPACETLAEAFLKYLDEPSEPC